MNGFVSALWAEAVKARASYITPLTAAGFMLLPLAGGLFMVILKNPEQARALGLIGAKAQLTAGAADWPTLLGMLSQGAAIGGAVVLALITAWVFGREFSDHTAKELMALPTPRWVIVSAKFVLIAFWTLGLDGVVWGIGLAVGAAVDIPGWSVELGWMSLGTVALTALLTFMLLPFVAWFASLGRGYLLPMGWAILMVAVANIVILLGYGDWFPWSVPVLVSATVKSYAEQVGLHSYLMVTAAFLAGIAATIAWWQSADQTR